MPGEKRPLHGIRLLEICPPSAGAIGRYFAELGADVITVPERDLCDDPVAGFVGSTSKRVMALDLAVEDDRARLTALADGADIIIHTRLEARAADVLSELVPDLAARNPKAIVAAVSPFGRGNAYQNWEMTSSVLDALIGVVARSGFPDREPLLPPGELALQSAYVQVAWTILLAYLNRLRTGEGDYIDVGLLEAAAQSMDSAFGMAGSATAGVPTADLPRGRPEVRHQYPVFRCKDGFVRICVLAPRQWQNMYVWLGSPDRYADPKFTDLHTRFTTPSILEDIAALFAPQTRAELEAESEKRGVPLAPVLTLEEALSNEHVEARCSLASLIDAEGRAITVPNGVIEIDGARAGVGHAPFAVGPEADWLEPRRFDPAAEAVRPERPLSGFTIIDLGVIVAGAEQSRLLADQGALTFKVEAKAFPDGGRQSKARDIVSVNFALGHRNKKGLGLNLRDPRGKQLLKQLVRQSDIVMSNFRPGTLTSLGLDHGVLSQENPAIIMADSSAYGPTGPWSKRAGYGPLVRASSGLTHMWAYLDAGGRFSDAMTIYPDHVAGRICAVAAVALLIRRMRTGEGGETSVAQSEVITNHLADRVAALSLQMMRPNRPDAPWGLYPCKGDDEWCVVTVRHSADWRALAMTIGRDDWLADPALATASGRIDCASALDQGISAWTAERTADEAMEQLQAAGVPAAKMLRVVEMPDFGYFKARDTFQSVRHPLIPFAFTSEKTLAHSRHLKAPENQPAPVPGEHSAWVASTILGLGEEEIEALLVEGVLERWAASA